MDTMKKESDNMQTEKSGLPSKDRPWLKYYEKGAFDARIPTGTIYEYIWNNNKDYLENIALVYFERQITYGELFDSIDKVARAFTAFGVKEKEIVTICLPNIPEAVYIFYALNRIGAVCHFLDPRAGENVMLQHVVLAKSRLLITIPERYDIFNKLRDDMGIENIVTVEIRQPAKQITGKTNTQKDMNWSDFIRQPVPETLSVSRKTTESDVCILHTGGTTGVPKGAVLCDSNFHSLVTQWKYLGLYYNRNSTLLSLMPPFVSFGLTANLHVPLSFGMKVVLIPEYNPSKTVEQIEMFRPNCIPASPAHWEAVYNNPRVRDMDLSFLRMALVGGDTLNVKIERGLNEIFAQCNADLKMRKGYGMTETATGITMTCFDCINLEGSVGIPLPQTTIGIFDEALNELPYNRAGEICVKSGNVMRGYYNNAKQTAKTLIVHPDDSVWLHTGDIGTITPDGVLYIKGRIKRIIIRHDGIKIYPVDVESKILENPYVSDCAVVGVKDSCHIQGEVPVAYVVTKQTKDDIKIQIKEFCENNIIDYAVPHTFYFIDKLPHTPNGKTDYKNLQEMASNINS